MYITQKSKRVSFHNTPNVSFEKRIKRKQYHVPLSFMMECESIGRASFTEVNSSVNVFTRLLNSN